MQLIIRDYVITEPIVNILNKVRGELTNGKLRYFKEKGNQIKVTCPHHNDGKEHDPDCYINASSDSKDLEYGYCHCFACGFSGRLSKFIGECFDKDESFGEKWLVDNFGHSVVDEQVDDLYDFNIVSDLELSQKNETKYLDESILDTMQTWHPYLDKRGISREVCNKFKIRYEPETKCVVFPVYDENDKLYMLTRRSVESKKFIIDSDKEKPIYLFNVIKKNNINEVTICESQFNALTLMSWHIPAIALFGTGTQHQYDLLNKSGILHYYLAFDGDGAGDRGIKRFLQHIRNDVFVDIIVMPRGKDVNDLTEEEFNSLKIISSDEWRAMYE